MPDTEQETIRNKTQHGLFHSKLSAHSFPSIVSQNTAPLHIRSLYLPGDPLATVVLRSNINGTLCTIKFYIKFTKPVIKLCECGIKRTTK